MQMMTIINETATDQNRPPSTNQMLTTPLIENVFVAFQWILFTIICQSIDLFGIGTNVINIYCFVKQGFKDPVNISLLGLAIADIGCLATLIWTNICFTPPFSEADLPFEPIEVQYLIGGMPHITFTRITAWLTAIIAMERCLCILAPLKIKTIVTTKRVSIINIIIYVLLITSVTPLYVVNRLAMKFVPAKNKTLYGLVFTENRDHVEKFSYAINNSLIPMTAFVVISVSTLILVIKLRKATRWRKASTAGAQVENISTRNQKITKMVVMMSTLFIVCFVPFSILFVGMSLEPELSLGGKYRGILITAAGFCTILESVNSSANVFIYYYMSSKYRVVLRLLFCERSKNSKS